MRSPRAKRRRDGRPHVHARAEGALAGAGQHGATDLGIGGDAAPGGGQLAQRGGIEGVGLRGAVDGDHGDVRVLGGQLEAGGHAPR
jgi:hypothetical protein